MPTPTYTPLANLTLGSAASSVTFSSIPATYSDLICVVLATGSTTLQGRIRLNSDTGLNYEYVRMSSDGSGRSSVTASDTSGFLSAIATARTTDSLQMNINIMNYALTNKNTTMIIRAGNAAVGTDALATTWRNTAAVTTIQILTSTGNWAVGSTFSLYGIVA
jgi:hypothetical protein